MNVNCVIRPDNRVILYQFASSISGLPVTSHDSFSDLIGLPVSEHADSAQTDVGTRGGYFSR